jgi:aspartate/methionine/tyrosine aminotransferase
VFARRTGWNLAPTTLAKAIESARAGGAALLDLSVSNPTEVGIAYPEDAILSALRSKAALHYSPHPKGLRPAREGVATYYRDFNVNMDPENIILTASTSEAYSFLFRLLCDSGDEVLVPQPSYPLFRFLADLNDVHLVPYQLFYDHGWQIDQHSLAQRITPLTRAIIVVHPNNPTGSYITVGDLEFLNQICSARNMAIIADEVFLDYFHSAPAAFSFTSNNSGLTFTLSGLSKICGLPQMKLAWIATSGPSAKVEETLARLEVIADTYLSVSTPVQLAAPTLLAQREIVITQLRQRSLANLHEVDAQLKNFRAVSRLESEGGWYATLRIPATRDDDAVALALLEHHNVIAHPGHLYDFTSDGFLVLSLITPERDFAEGMRRILTEISGSER